MSMVSAKLDLHTHSTASDGLLTPTELVTQAHEAGLSMIALTDHDTTNGLAEAQAAGAAMGVEVVPGIEINTYLPHGQGEAHVLGYYLDTANADLQAFLQFLRDTREKRGERMVALLREQGYDVTWARVRELAHGAVGRPHVAMALMEQGYADSIADAFDRYISPGRPAYVPRFKMVPEDAVRMLRSVRGVPVLAHPLRLFGLEDDLLPRLMRAGLLGLECYYGEYDEPAVENLLALAEQHGLIATGGSDYHGLGVHPTPLGGHYVPPEAATLLRAMAYRLATEPAPPFTPPSH
ncbi:MAG TPA: PHP domain-containing protein [Ktedonobacterales bacterium]|nr:PHP domain-containing protein [Ktedonobacterales bacterium]